MVKQTLGRAVESSFSLYKCLKPVLPQVTQDILREQKSAKNYKTLETLADVVSEENYNASHLAKMGILNR